MNYCECSPNVVYGKQNFKLWYYFPQLISDFQHFKRRKLNFSFVRACIQMSRSQPHSFNAIHIAICTFACSDNVADVTFNPCNHRVICWECVEKTPLRRCPLCYNEIETIHTDDGRELAIIGTQKFGIILCNRAVWEILGIWVGNSYGLQRKILVFLLLTKNSRCEN